MLRSCLCTLFIAGIALYLAGCGSGQPTAINQSPVVATPSATALTIVETPTQTLIQVPTPSPTMALIATSTPAPVATETSSVSAANVMIQTIIATLKAANLPIAETVIYTAETDPNKLLGRPNQYVAKANWHDSRLPTPEDPNQPDVSDGGGIEIFMDNEGAKRRADYIQELGKSMPFLVEYDYVRGPILLRVSGKLTPAQAEEYKKALDSIPIP